MKYQSFLKIMVNLSRSTLLSSSLKERKGGGKRKTRSFSSHLCLCTIGFALFLSSPVPLCILCYVFLTSFLFSNVCPYFL